MRLDIVVEPMDDAPARQPQKKSLGSATSNWRQLYFQKQYGAIPPNAIDHPWNPLHQQFNPGAQGAQFNQQYPNYYPPRR